MVTWQDMVAMYWEKPYMEGERYRSPGEKLQFETEFHRMIEVLTHTPLRAKPLPCISALAAQAYLNIQWPVLDVGSSTLSYISQLDSWVPMTA